MKELELTESESAYLRSVWERLVPHAHGRGILCPLCKQMVLFYRRGMNRKLAEQFRLIHNRYGRAAIHLPVAAHMVWVNGPGKDGEPLPHGDLWLLDMHGFIRPLEPNESGDVIESAAYWPEFQSRVKRLDDDNKVSVSVEGWYRVTSKGAAWLAGEPVERYAVTYAGKLIARTNVTGTGLDKGPDSIHEAFARKASW